MDREDRVFVHARRESERIACFLALRVAFDEYGVVADGLYGMRLVEGVIVVMMLSVVPLLDKNRPVVGDGERSLIHMLVVEERSGPERENEIVLAPAGTEHRRTHSGKNAVFPRSSGSRRGISSASWSTS